MASTVQHRVSTSPQSVLVVSESSDFAPRITARWQQEAALPDFAALKPQSFLLSHFPSDLVIVEQMRPRLLLSVLETAVEQGRPALCILNELVPEALRERAPRVMFLRRDEGWLDLLVQVGSEVLRRIQAQCRLRRAEQKAHSSRRDAALGRYMLEVRHSLNNALTSVLGNAELLMLEQSQLPPAMRDQLHVVHEMTLRMHEVMQRFSSLDVEMRFAEKESPAAVAGGSSAVDREAVTV